MLALADQQQLVTAGPVLLERRGKFAREPSLLMTSRPFPLVPPQIISGQQLPKVNKSKNSIVDPKVTIEIHGVQQDNNKKQTKVIENNGKGLSSMLCARGAVTLSFHVAECSLPRPLPCAQSCPGAPTPAHAKQMLLAYFSAGILVLGCWWHELAPQTDVPMGNIFQASFPPSSL